MEKRVETGDYADMHQNGAPPVRNPKHGIEREEEAVIGGKGRRGYCILYGECYELGDYHAICAIDKFVDDLVNGRIDVKLNQLINVLNPDVVLATPMAVSPKLFFPTFLDKVLPYAIYWKRDVHSVTLTNLFALIDECAMLYLDTTVFPLLVREVLLEDENETLSPVQNYYRNCREKIREVMMVELREDSTLVKFKDKKRYLDYLELVKKTFRAWDEDPE